MKKIGIYYGSTTGTCEDLANRIAQALGVDSADVHNAADLTASEAEQYDVLVLGTSTWGAGDMQDDWYDAAKTLAGANLKGKDVALFCCGDCESYPDTFCEGMKGIYDAIAASGCNFVGATSADGYTYDDSTAVEDGNFIGLALDEVNESDKTDERIATWAKAVQAAIA